MIAAIAGGYQRPHGGFPAGLRSIPGCVLSLDAYLGTSPGDGKWTDQVAGQAYIPIDVALPVFSASDGPGGRPTVQHRGGRLQGPSLAALTAGEAFVVLRDDATLATSNNGWGSFGVPQASLYTHSDGLIYDDFGSTSRKNSINPVVDVHAAFHVVNVITTSSEWTMLIDGIQRFTTAANIVGFSATPWIGGQAFGQWSGSTSEVALFSAKLSTADRAAALAFLNTKWGL